MLLFHYCISVGHFGPGAGARIDLALASDPGEFTS